MTDSTALRPLAATLLALAGVRAGETVLDVGCGTGLLTHPAGAAAGESGRVFGLDPDPGLLAAARARRESGAGWVVGDPARLPFAAGSVTKVLYAPLPGRVAAVPAEWARVLAPGGRVAVALWEGDPAALLRSAGLRVVHETAEDLALPDGAASVRYATATTAG